MAEKKLPIVTVSGNGVDNRVVLWEKNSQHPNGEVFIVNDGKAVKAARTPNVSRLIGEGRLVEQAVKVIEPEKKEK